jgi:hypothetical protein
MAWTVPIVAQDDIAAVADHVQGGVKADVARPTLAIVTEQRPFDFHPGSGYTGANRENKVNELTGEGRNP